MTYTLVSLNRAQRPLMSGLQLSWVSATSLLVADGECSDSTNSYDIVVNTNGVGTTLSGSSVGLNALDTGTIAASTMYYIYAVGDPSGFNIPGFVISASSTGPVMPKGLNPSNYSLSRLVGFALTNGSANFLAFYMTGSASQRFYQYDVPVAVVVPSSGTSTTFVAVDLSVAVPLVNFGRSQLQYNWTNNAVTDILSLQPAGGTGTAWVTKGQAAGIPQDGNALILPLIASSKPEIAYKTTTGGSVLNTMAVQGFEFAL